MDEKQFVLNVCNSQLRSVADDIVVLKSKTLLDSSLAQTIESLDIEAGQGNKLLYSHAYGKKLTATIEDAVWKPEFIALQSGTSIATALKDFWVFNEPVTLTSGVGSVTETPVGNVYVTKSDGTSITLTPTVKSFTVPGGLDTTVTVSYQYNVSVDSILINADLFPKAYELTLFTEMINGKGTKVADIQIIIYNFKPDGALDLSFKSNANNTQKMTGKCLSNDNGDYAIILIKPVIASTSYIAIATTPSAITLSSTATTQQLTVYGVKGGLYSNQVIPATDCTYLSETTATATVSAGGLITRIASGTSLITTTHTASGLTDQITVTCS